MSISICFNTVYCFTNKGCNVENSLCVAGLGVLLELGGNLALVAVVVHHLLLIEQLDDGEEDNLKGGNFASMGQHCVNMQCQSLCSSRKGTSWVNMSQMSTRRT